MRDYVKGKPPAADAGPRQHSKKCTDQLYSALDAKCICGSDTVAAPPVPQEAAPARHKHTWMPYIRSCSVCGQLERLENDYEK